ncbi:Coiled-coil domain-containing protein 47 [Geranomyces michiganensis]|nr:Coiled-coil domain-containing protein 47 [Geranomyces michiganensis]
MKALVHRLAVAIFVVLALFAAVSAATAAVSDYDDYEYEDEDADDAAAAAAATPSAGRFQSNLMPEHHEAAAAAGEARPVYKWSDVQLSSLKTEMALLASIVVYIITYFIGRRKNKALVTNLYKLTADIWERNFALIGDAGHRVLRDGPHAYILSASGRVNVTNIYCRLRLAARYDWFQKLISLFTGQPGHSADRMTMIATLDGNESDGMTLAILLKSLVRNVADRRWDLGEFPKKREMLGTVRSGPFPSQHYTVLAEAPEFLNNAWEDPDVRRALWASLGLDAEGKGDAYDHPIIEQIVLTDLPSSRPTKLADLETVPRTLTFVLRLPDLTSLTAKDQAAIRDACELFIMLIDYIGQYGRVVPETKAKLVKARLAAQQHILKAAEEERKEELARKKAAEKRERDKAAAKLSPDEARKYEERERKKELKRAQGKKMKKGKVSI